jgi:Holliday junction resolvase RusA-like endonuclease
MRAFIVPGNPIPKARARVLRTGRSYTPRTTQEHEETVRVCAVKAGVRPENGPIRMNLHFFRENAQRCDWDNLAKCVTDALNGIAYEDDSQIVQCHVLKDVDRENPRTEVEIF